MARIARIVVPGLPHHVVQRGNRRQDVFFNDRDRFVYITLLRTACEEHGVRIWAYCLMRNHVHVIAVPEHADSLARCFADAHVRYTRRINRREGWQGHLWQARFCSRVMDERYLVAAVRYVERNPVTAGLVRLAWQYRWSSAAWHVGIRSRDPLVIGDEPLRTLIDDWRSYLDIEQDPRATDQIERTIGSNRPLGEESFLEALERQLHRSLRRRPRGRPRKMVAVPNL